MRKITKRSAAVITTAVLAVGGMGVGAWAAGWFSGTGEAVAATEAAKPVSAVITAKTKLYPGAAADARVQASNPNDYAVKVTGLTIDNSRTPEKALPAGCNFGNAKLSFNPYRSFIIPAKSTNLVLADVTELVQMGKDADGACANVETFTIPVTFAGEVS